MHKQEILVITSYSIHYTKLYDRGDQGAFLRHLSRSLTKSQMQEVKDLFEADANFRGVITSYSIHYTKLYDDILHLRLGERAGEMAQERPLVAAVVPLPEVFLDRGALAADIGDVVVAATARTPGLFP